MEIPPSAKPELSWRNGIKLPEVPALSAPAAAPRPEESSACCGSEGRGAASHRPGPTGSRANLYPGREVPGSEVKEKGGVSIGTESTLNTARPKPLLPAVAIRFLGCCVGHEDKWAAKMPGWQR